MILIIIMPIIVQALLGIRKYRYKHVSFVVYVNLSIKY